MRGSNGSNPRPVVVRTAGAFIGMIGEARPAFGQGRWHVRFLVSRGSVRAGVDYMFTGAELVFT